MIGECSVNIASIIPGSTRQVKKMSGAMVTAVNEDIKLSALPHRTLPG